MDGGGGPGVEADEVVELQGAGEGLARQEDGGADEELDGGHSAQQGQGAATSLLTSERSLIPLS